MAISNILVAFNGSENAASAVRLAIRMAKEHDAHLTGLFAHSTPTYTAEFDPYMPAETLALLTRQEQETETRVDREFKDLCASEGMGDRVSFLIEQGHPNDVCSAYARTYDLTVIGRAEGDFWQLHREPHPDTVALQSGRAVIVAPKVLGEGGLPRDVMLAWDGKRAAARALADAMTLIEGATRVLVLHVGEDDSAVRKPGRDIMEHLSRHGIPAELRIEPRAGRSIGETVVETYHALGPELLIMGAYERSRFSETLLGGVTLDVLAAADIPVLMSH
ncbi:MAG: universal stress protein [Pseudomonadota bacterium]